MSVMRYADALAGELTLFSRGELNGRRGAAVTRLANEFVRQAPFLNEDAIELYDVALRWLVADLEQETLAALSEQFADIPNAPADTIRILAFHDEIAVAGPVIARSPRLEAGDLIAIIGAKGEEHIMLVAKRSDLTETVTDRVIAVGSSPVLRALAANKRAPLSENGSSILCARAGGDQQLADALAERFHLPEALRKRLIDDATSVLRLHLSTINPAAPPRMTDLAIANGMAAIAERVRAGVRSLPPAHGFSQDLSHEHAYLELLRAQRLREALGVVADRAGLSRQLVYEMFAGEDFELMTTALRAADMSWAAAEETLAARASALGRPALREMMRNKFHMMSQRDAARRVRIVKLARSDMVASQA